MFLKISQNFTGKHLYQILYLMRLQASDLHLYCKREHCAKFSCEFCGVFDNTFFTELFWRLIQTIQVHKVDKNVSRYWKKDIKLISIEPILVTFCQIWKWFCMVRKLWKPPSWKTRTPAVELFRKISQRVKAVGYFRRRTPSWMFDKILNATLPNNLL